MSRCFPFRGSGTRFSLVWLVPLRLTLVNLFYSLKSSLLLKIKNTGVGYKLTIKKYLFSFNRYGCHIGVLEGGLVGHSITISFLPPLYKVIGIGTQSCRFYEYLAVPVNSNYRHAEGAEFTE